MLLAPAPFLLAGGEEEAAGAAASTIPAGYFGAYDPAIDMEWIKSTWQSARESVNNKLKPATGETFEDNRWTRAMRDELGINVTGHLLRRPLDLLRLPARLGERQQHRLERVPAAGSGRHAPEGRAGVGHAAHLRGAQGV